MPHTGATLIRPPKHTRLDDLRLLLEIETDDCIEWPFARHPSGYGAITQYGYAHRAALILSGSEPRPDTNVCRHLCNNPPCVNLRHLQWGSQADNMADREARGVWLEAMRVRGCETHCKAGHPFDDENTYRHPRGERVCRSCARAKRLARKAAR